MSSCKSLHNEVEFIESSRHTKKVSNTNYYCIIISGFDFGNTSSSSGRSDDRTVDIDSGRARSDNELSKLKSSLAKFFLTQKRNQPLVVYVDHSKIYLLFTSVDESQEHFLGGLYHKLISYYSCLMCKWMIKNEYPISIIETNLIEYESHIEIFTFFSVKVYDNKMRCIERLFDDTTIEINISQLTEKEIIDILKKEGVNYNDISNADKYGTFAKLRKKGAKIVIDKMEEYLDSRESKKYLDFILR